MVYEWVQGRTMHLLALKNLELEKNFEIEKFPEYRLTCDHYQPNSKKEFIALYYHDYHRVYFSEKYFYSEGNWFPYVYFHELIHSTDKFNGRYRRMVAKAGPNLTLNVAGLEERIADIGALILCLTFESAKLNVKKLVKICIDENITEFALPWQEIEDAVLCFIKNKDCSKLKSQLQLVKGIITENNLTTIYEGNFDGRYT